MLSDIYVYGKPYLWNGGLWNGGYPFVIQQLDAVAVGLLDAALEWEGLGFHLFYHEGHEGNEGCWAYKAVLSFGHWNSGFGFWVGWFMVL